MIDSFKKILLVPLFGALLTSNAFATAVTSNSNLLTGTNGLINVTEQNYCGRTACGVNSLVSRVQYSLNILAPNSPIAITAFGVSTNTMASYLGAISTWRSGWAGQQIAAANWNSSPFGASASYSSLFGNDLYVNLFSMSTGAPITTTSDALFEFFHYLGAPASQFVAFNANGGIVSQSLGVANTVPEPAPLALLGFGLLGIGLMRRRRRS